MGSISEAQYVFFQTKNSFETWQLGLRFDSILSNLTPVLNLLFESEQIQLKCQG